LRRTLKRFDLILSVSQSIPYEMGDQWINRLKVLGPNTSYEHIKNIAKTNISKPHMNYDAIFFARLIPKKGVLDLPLIWKKVLEKGVNVKLAVAGKFYNKSVEIFFFKLIESLSLNDYITFLGFLSHSKLTSLLKTCKVMVYPSYLDAISLAIMESLSHNIPVIAYEIPAIKFNYERVNAVIRVSVGDVNAMANKIFKFLKGDLKFDFHQIRMFLNKFSSWSNVVKSEAKIIKKYFN